jgi:ribosomal protein S18 acetylase RimI-like enzyme
MGNGDWEARLTVGDELSRVGGVLGRAFQDDPMWAWALGRSDTEDRSRRLARFFDAIVRKVYAAKQLVFTVDDLAGVAVWTPPGGWRLSFADEARVALPVLAAFGAAGSARLLQLLGGVTRAHERAPHYYLFAIGTDPAHQGRGAGAALLAPMLARCDAEKLPAYLESSNPANLSFYRRHGFVPTGELRFGSDVVVTPMRRDPRD